MAQRTLNAFVVLSGRVDNSFGQIGTELIGLGSTIDQVSAKLIDFGKESLNVYKSFEKNMTELETVWAKNGTFTEGSRELASAMKDMEKAANEWASSTIFHTNDVSNAMVEAAHAGWGYNEMLDGIPAAMAMAQAGSMDLSTAMNYVVKAQKSFGLNFEDMTGFMDEWIYAANRSAGTTQEFGDTFLRMGSVVRMAANPEELLAITKVMHDMGTTGEAAGTMLKTTFMKLYAPSGKATDVLKAMGYTAAQIENEFGQIRDDTELMKALNELKLFGFDAFDENGQAKPVLETFKSLAAALIAVSGEVQQADESLDDFYGRVLKNENVMGIISEVFGIRGMQGAMNLLRGLNEGTELYIDLMDAAAAGTTAYVQEKMGDTLYGKTEHFLSQVEALHNKVGGELAGDWELILEYVGGIVEDIANLDEVKLGALVDGLKTLAVSGASMIAAGSLFRFIGYLFTIPGALSLVAVASGAVASAWESLKEAKLEGLFGDMSLDEKTLNEYITTLGNDYNAAFEKVNAFNGALETSVEKYNEASRTFSSDLLNAMLTGADFTPEEKAALEQKGIAIYREVVAAITASRDVSAEFWAAMYGGEGTAEYDEKYQGIIDILNQGKDSALAVAEGISEQVKEALMHGWAEGFDEDDYAVILDAMRQYDQLIARAQNEALMEEQFVEQEKLLRKARTASLEEIEALADTAAAQRDADLAEVEDRYLTERAKLKYQAIQSGMTEAEAEKYVSERADVDSRYEEWRNRIGSQYDNFLMTLWESQIAQSDLGGAYGTAQNYAKLYMGGAITKEAALAMLTDALGGSLYADSGLSTENIRSQLAIILGNAISDLGGEEAIRERVAFYRDTGESETAQRLLTMFAAEQLANGFNDVIRTEKLPWDWFGWGGSYANTGSINTQEGYLTGYYTRQNNQEEIEKLAAEDARLIELYEKLETAQQRMVFGYTGAEEYVAAAQAALDSYLAGEGNGLSTDLKITGAEDAAKAAIVEAQAYANDHSLIIHTQTSGRLGAYVFAELTSDNDPDYYHEGVMPNKARGGRETRPAIFAEAGIPEWYIPEEHTANTARLILGAAYGSGFDIFDLAEAAGASLYAEGGYSGASLSWPSMNASSGGEGGGGDSGIQITYSPVINAENAEGVHRALMEDKKRMMREMDKWWEKKQLYESMVKY